jgi:4-alpha-glucanotransferase
MGASSLSFKWLSKRAAGLLLHPTSLPGAYGVGVLGQHAFATVDFLKEAGIDYWQMLPLGPTGFGDSPYQSLSIFAGNPYLIDFQPLLENGLLLPNELHALEDIPADRVDFARLYLIKQPLLRLAYRRFKEQKRAYLPNYGLFDDFQQREAHWLEAFCGYMALKEAFNGAFWGEWPTGCRTLAAARQSREWQASAPAREAHAFNQYLFHGQWRELKSYASQAGIEIIGDVPIFVALDSADVWAEPHLFEMSKAGQPDVVAGVPPDYFSATGQLWGNPLYAWKAMEKDGYNWWIRRLQSAFDLFDVVRLDHFRGFHDYWRIPAGSADARSGTWAKGPGKKLFKAIHASIPEARLIAEDLGEINDGVRDLRDSLGLPGMAIFHFAFGGGPDNLYLPHNLTQNQVVYAGTHDNNTSLGWYEHTDELTRDHLRRYLRVDGGDIAWDLLRMAYRSVAGLAVIQAQDLLSLDQSARMNTPGQQLGNWQWRLSENDFANLRQASPYLMELKQLYGR